jgi:phosphoribosylanthranilate isomerase
VFAPSSRQIAPQKAADIVKRLPTEIVTVGVFRHETRQRIVDIVHQAGLRAAQLHGHETATDSRWVRARVPLVIKAFASGDPGLDDADDYGADAILIDSAVPGSGEVFDWSLAEGAPSNRKVILAGGLTADNVADAVRRVRPWGVDVSTGVESSPGRKDARKLRAFIQTARLAEPMAASPSSTDPDESPAGTTPDDRPRPFDWMADDNS